MGALIVFLAVAGAALGAPADLLTQAVRTPSPVVNPQAGTMGVPMQLVLLLTGLTVLPALVMSLTPFLRITLVLHFLRQAIGTQSTPSNPVLIGLALFLTMIIMQPTA